MINFWLVLNSLFRENKNREIFPYEKIVKMKTAKFSKSQIFLHAKISKFKVDEGEESFLGNRFIDEDDIDDDYELESESENNEAGNQTDVTEVEQEIEQTEEEDVDMENIVKEKSSNETRNSATI